MHVSQFQSIDGYVVHGIPAETRNADTTITGWFAEDDALIDAEFLYRDGRARPVKRGGPAWRTTARIGPAYFKTWRHAAKR